MPSTTPISLSSRAVESRDRGHRGPAVHHLDIALVCPRLSTTIPATAMRRQMASTSRSWGQRRAVSVAADLGASSTPSRWRFSRAGERRSLGHRHHAVHLLDLANL